MYGGAIPVGSNLQEFLINKAQKEVGLTPILEGLIGFFYTTDEVAGIASLQPCYVALIEDLTGMITDKDHDAVQVLTLAEYQALPQEERHWYPDCVFEAALSSMTP